MNGKTLDYARQHADEDVRQLALRGCKDPDVELTVALQQIQGRQTARQKLPSWAAVDGIQYPPHLNMEQCSSEQTARYKADLCRRLLSGSQQTSLYDLTGGFGVDFAWMSEAFDQSTYVERDAQLFAISSANFEQLGKKVEKVNADGIDVLHTIGHATMIFLDPARRDDHGGRTYGISDCTPDVLAVRDELLKKADFVVLKLSPMLDWRKAVSDLGEQNVSEVHIVSVANECKELLVVMQQQSTSLTVFCVNDDQTFVFNPILATIGHERHVEPSLLAGAGKRLLVPNASVMKAGCFDEQAQQFSISQIARNSHLFISDGVVEGFPGRQFAIDAVSSMSKQDLKTRLAGIRQANIAVRNFPLTVAELRRRLKLSEGGSKYIFATTLANGNRVLLICQRLS